MPHNVLNARQHEQEAQIVADAGKFGAVTIATNMAGRGTDIQLGGNVEMKVLEALNADPDDPSRRGARPDRGRTCRREAARCSTPAGCSCWPPSATKAGASTTSCAAARAVRATRGARRSSLSLEDDLMRIFGSERLDKVLSTLGMKEGEAIIHPWVNKSLERAQAKVEGRNFDIRKQLLKFDDVMNDQRKVIFGQRREIMEDADLSEIVADMRHQVIDDLVETAHAAARPMPTSGTPRGCTPR